VSDSHLAVPPLPKRFARSVPTAGLLPTETDFEPNLIYRVFSNFRRTVQRILPVLIQSSTLGGYTLYMVVKKSILSMFSILSILVAVR
jgi:hypothetical protein